MKKRFLTILTSAVGILSLAACNNEGGVTPTGDRVIPEGKYEEFDFRGQGSLDHDYIALKHLFYNLRVGEKKTIEADTLPSEYATSSLSYSSSDESVASVSASGEITANKKGIADITVSSSDGAFSNKVRVSVSSPTDASASRDVIDAINAVYDAPDYESARKVIRYEYSEEIYSCEGVRDHGMESFEAIAFNADNGYFMVEGPTLYYKTTGGTPELADGQWIMYPINQGVYTRLVHITPLSKKYMDMNTAGYESYDRIIKDIMNFFFVSGEKIVNDLLETFDGKDDFQRYAEAASLTKLHAVNDNSLCLELSEVGENQVVDYDDEINYYDIPTDTVYSYNFKEYMLNSGSRTTGVDISMTMFYELNGKNWTRSFNRSQVFEEDFDEFRITDAKKEGFQEVYSIYDL